MQKQKRVRFWRWKWESLILSPDRRRTAGFLIVVVVALAKVTYARILRGVALLLSHSRKTAQNPISLVEKIAAGWLLIAESWRLAMVQEILLNLLRCESFYLNKIFKYFGTNFMF